MLAQLPQDTLEEVDPRLRDPNGRWVGTSGRARTVIFNTDFIDPVTDLPESILAFTDEEWKGRVGWAPWNGSFQAFVTALRLTKGDDVARGWLGGMRDNDARDYPNNVSIVQAVANGEVEVGFVNHYYLERFLAEHGPDFKARNYYIGNGDPGALVLVAGVGILEASDNQHTAQEFVDFLLSEPAQQYFTSEIKEYPVAAGVVPEGDLPPIDSLNPPDVDLGNLTDLEGTLDLLRMWALCREAEGGFPSCIEPHEGKRATAPDGGSFLLLAATYVLSVDIRATRGASITGDEPFYLLTTQSLLADGDFDLGNQYDTRSYQSFFDHADDLWLQSVPKEDGRLLSPHNPGLSFLVIPGLRPGWPGRRSGSVAPVGFRHPGVGLRAG